MVDRSRFPPALPETAHVISLQHNRKRYPKDSQLSVNAKCSNINPSSQQMAERQASYRNIRHFGHKENGGTLSECVPDKKISTNFFVLIIIVCELRFQLAQSPLELSIELSISKSRQDVSNRGVVNTRRNKPQQVLQILHEFRVS